MVKECPPGKILNPATNRCVSIDGKIGKELLKAQAKPASSSSKSTTSKSSSKSSSSKSSSSPTPPPPPKKETRWVNDELYKEARIWVRAPWRDMEDHALQCGAENPQWIELYTKYAPALETVFKVRGKYCALDAYSLRLNTDSTTPLYYFKDAKPEDYTDIDTNKFTERLEFIYKNLETMNRIELAIMISNCVIAYFSWGKSRQISDLCFELLKKYYHKDTPKIPYYKTLSWKVINYEHGQDTGRTFFDQLRGKWKEIGNNMEKYPFNQALLKK